jgi:threonine dehydrogenase-like Zn-dependent dehydrogenase
MSRILAAVATEIRHTELRELDLPEIPTDGGLLKVEMTGVCGSDWPMYLSYPSTKGPLILGHETVGFVDRLGAAAAQRFGVKEGDRVALEEYIPCGHCKYCRSGDFRLCDATEPGLGGLRFGSTPLSIAPSLWGGYCHYQYLHPGTVFHKVPAHLPAEQAAMALPMGNGIEWAYLQGGIAIGETILIQGPGQQGLACVIAAREAGAACIIVSGLGNATDTARLALARKLGAHHAIEVESQDLLETVADITGGAMCDLVVDCSSGGPETVTAAIQLARKRGRVILGAQKRKPIPVFNADLVIQKFLTVKGMRGHSFAAVELALQLIASGRYPMGEMCTHLFGLGEVDTALRTVGGEGLPGAIHIAVDPWR